MLTNNDAAWMSHPDRPCRPPINDPVMIRQHADEGWYPKERLYDRAKAKCSGCPVRTECLQYALDNREEHGIWGGLTPYERGRLLKKRAVA